MQDKKRRRKDKQINTRLVLVVMYYIIYIIKLLIFIFVLLKKTNLSTEEGMLRSMLVVCLYCTNRMYMHFWFFKNRL